MVVVPIEAPVVTALTELGNGKPRFYSTPEIIAFCRKWRLPTNHVWLFSTRRTFPSSPQRTRLEVFDNQSSFLCRRFNSF
ncbi:hypothetical protein AAHE18_08G224100 [Arachis hypogaea]